MIEKIENINCRHMCFHVVSNCRHNLKKINNNNSLEIKNILTTSFFNFVKTKNIFFFLEETQIIISIQFIVLYSVGRFAVLLESLI